MHGVYDGEHETVTIKEAAERLGVSEQAVRQRIRRKTLPAQRLDGKLYVVLSAGYDADTSSPSHGHDGVDARVASVVRDAYTELVTQLRRENELLREQLSVKDGQLQANQVIMAQLAERVRALPAPREEPAQPKEQTPENPMPARPRSWWRFWEWYSPTP